MKKLSLLFFILLSFTGWSQKNEATEGVSLYGGAGIAHVFSGINLNTTTGYMAGLESNVYHFTKTSILNAGINYTFQGADYNQIKNEETISGTLNFSYINFPLLYRYQNPNGLFLEAGFQTGFMVGATNKPDKGENSNFNDHLKLVSFGLPIGAGYWFSNRLSIGVRAVFGLTNMSNDGLNWISDDGNHQNFIICGLIRYSFHKNQAN